MIYLTVAILLILASLPAIQTFLQKVFIGIPAVIISLVYAIVLFGIFLIVKYLLEKGNVENFFFQVSGPKACSGLYMGKPTTFQYSQVGSGDCKSISYPPLGMNQGVKSCQDEDVYGDASPKYPIYGTTEMELTEQYARRRRMGQR
jgi:hypothetical protein